MQLLELILGITKRKTNNTDPNVCAVFDFRNIAIPFWLKILPKHLIVIFHLEKFKTESAVAWTLPFTSCYKTYKYKDME